MKHLNLNIRLLIAFGILLIGSVVSDQYFRKMHDLPYKEVMKQSVELTKKWFSIIQQFKTEKGIKSDVISNVPHNYMIGNEWSVITTTLGSLEAKEISTNPDFSALIIRLLHEAHIKKDDKVGIVLSGSFPSLAIAVLAALQTVKAQAVVMSSVGASTYGANQPEATWLDMESCLRKRGGLKFSSMLVSMGAEDDAGTGLAEEGFTCIRNVAQRNNVILYIPGSLKESIETRLRLFTDASISLFINIGGNQSALGDCPHSLTIPNGLHFNTVECSDENRGLIIRMNETGIPIINLLDIKNLASMYGIDISPGKNYEEATRLYAVTTSNRRAIGIILGICTIPIYFLRKKIQFPF